ncbi:hypothetical protein Taro_029231, partial [Colocasia esculenta]|nr:hypothetical protein [Colocasia esculenta]
MRGRRRPSSPSSDPDWEGGGRRPSAPLLLRLGQGKGRRPPSSLLLLIAAAAAKGGNPAAAAAEREEPNGGGGGKGEVRWQRRRRAGDPPPAWTSSSSSSLLRRPKQGGRSPPSSSSASRAAAKTGGTPCVEASLPPLPLPAGGTAPNQGPSLLVPLLLLLSEAGRQREAGNSLMRILYVAAFAVSGYASTEGRQCKPFNPLLGETYEADYPDKGLRFFSEKVSHHPMIVACHCDGKGWKFWGDSNLKGKFWGRSIQLDPIGILTLQFADGETFQWSKVTTSIYNIILGKIYCDHYGTMRIRGSGNYSCKLKFKEQSIIDRNPHQVHGFVQDNRTGEKVAMLVGKWDEAMYYVLGDPTTKPKGYDPMSEAVLLWERDKSMIQTRYNLTPFAISLNELTPNLMERLPPTDSRLRPDQRRLENGEYELANSEKLRLEQLQRQ